MILHVLLIILKFSPLLNIPGTCRVWISY